jgi:hypothetical protein
VGRSSVFGL